MPASFESEDLKATVEERPPVPQAKAAHGSSARPSPLHKAGRLLWLGSEVFLCFVRYIRFYVGAKGRLTPAQRAQWLHQSARRTFRVFSSRIDWVGELPRKGLLVANHLSYLDIVLIAAVTPARFVSKSEVKSWPIFGFFARCAGTIFIDRARRQDTARANAELKAALAGEELLVLFPEGTSTDGRSVLPFRSSLLAPVAGEEVAVFAGHISYALPGGNVGQDVCYWGDMTLVPHLLNLVTKQDLAARIAFNPVVNAGADRKELARHLHAEVTRLKELHSL